MLDYRTTHALIIDTETTDNDTSIAHVIELAHKAYGESWRPHVQRFSPPEHKVKWGAIATHHILPSELIGMPPSSTALSHIPPATYWIGHNIDFDWAVLGKPDVKRICTLAMSRAVWPELDSHKLSSVVYFLRGANPNTRTMLKIAHSAGDDVVLCEIVLQEILRKTGILLMDDLWEFSEDCRIPRQMTFGKFQGQPISAVDRGYANWYRKQPDPDPYVLEAFKREGLI